MVEEPLREALTVLDSMEQALPDDWRVHASRGLIAPTAAQVMLAGMVLSNLVEEKANKIIEILAAAIPMEALFLGKLFAMLGVSLVGIATWLTFLWIGVDNAADSWLAPIHTKNAMKSRNGFPMRPRKPKSNAMPWPTFAANCVARVYSIRLARKARRIRPPSIGKAGIRLKINALICSCARNASADKGARYQKMTDQP